MLGDSSEKSKNPLKKAMRRRNTKAVAFSAPTYIEASDVEYSSDDESDDGGFFIDDQEPADTEADDTQQATTKIWSLSLSGRKHKRRRILRRKSQRLKTARKLTDIPLRCASRTKNTWSPKVRRCRPSFILRPKWFTDCLQMVLLAGREMALYGIRIRSSRMTQPNRKRYP